MFHSNEYLYQNEKCAILYPQYRGDKLWVVVEFEDGRIKEVLEDDLIKTGNQFSWKRTAFR